MRINLLEYLGETVAKHGGKTAVIEGEQSIVFSELDARARKLGGLLSERANGVIRKPVAVFLAKSIGSVVSDIGILYSGNAYMNLDVKTPAARIGAILERVDPLLVITDEKNAPALSGIWPADRTVRYDELDFDALSNDSARLTGIRERLIDTDPLCIINTSGSTGTPKGVVLNHRSFIDYTCWAIERTGLQHDEVFGSLAPIVFDHFSYELALIMVHSCTMVIIPDSYGSFPARLMQYIAQMNVTYIFWVPTIMVNVANMDLLTRIPQPTLRMVWFAGEVFPTKQFNYWKRNLPQAKFVNLYGPTEITVDCTYYIVERELRDDEPIPIGYACKNTDILILNKNNEPCTVNEEGELCVRGTSLSMGYYNNPQKTAEVFVQNPLNTAYPELIYRTGDIVFSNENGEIIFKGRNDTLIKHMGKRIELGEIEHIIVNTLNLVKNGCAVYDHIKKEIVFFYEGESIPVSDLRKAISTSLPKYMLPSVFINMPELPRNTNGKIDRLLLRQEVEG